MSSKVHTRDRAKKDASSLTPRLALSEKPLSRRAVSPTVPPVARDVLQSPGQPLDSETRTFMESRFGHDFGHVRVHTDLQAEESAQAVNASAYTVGRHLVFGPGQYAPGTGEGRRLLTHELTHTVQQSLPKSYPRSVDQAEAAAVRFAAGESVNREAVGSAPVGLYPQVKAPGKEEDKKPRRKEQGETRFRVPPEGLKPDQPYLRPTPTPEGKPKEPEMPSRIPIPWLSGGKFSLGLRLGFPGPPEKTKLEEALFAGRPDLLKKQLQKAEMIDQMLTGKVPTGWEQADKSELARYVWSIFSNNIAPDVARKITGGLSVSTGTGGLSYELDLVLITDFSEEVGGGASFTVRW